MKLTIFAAGILVIFALWLFSEAWMDRYEMVQTVVDCLETRRR